MAVDELENFAGCGAITLLGDFFADFLIGLVIEVERIGIEDRVAPQPKWLVDLKVKTDRSHRSSW